MDFVLNLEYKSYVPLYRRLSDALRKAILDGRLKPGQPVPSVGDLSTNLRISRPTVLKAIEDLQRQGFLKSQRGAGTCVVKTLPGDLGDLLKPQTTDQASDASIMVAELTEYAKRVELVSRQLQEAWPADAAHVSFNRPDIAISPIAQWKTALIEHCKPGDLSPVSYPVHPAGYPPLREAIAAYLHRTRAVKCKSDRVFVFSSQQLRLDLISRILIDPGDYVAFEEPGDPAARATLKTHGAEIISIPVDGDGLNVDYLESLSYPFKIVYVTPSHHSPTGVVLSLSRRKRLLDWAKHHNVYIIEDDSDCHYRYGGRPLPSLQRLDKGDSVLYLASTWKELFQVLRFGFVVVPERLKNVALATKMQLERYLPVLEQLALTDFINDGQVEWYIRKARSIYEKKRQSLIFAVTRHLLRQCTIAPESAGMHILITINACLEESDILSTAHQSNILIMSTAPYYAGAVKHNEFIVPFSNIDPNNIEEAVAKWANLIKESKHSF